MFAHKTAVITGTTSGLGWYLAERLAGEGWNLILINRSLPKTLPLLDRLKATNSKIAVDILEADLSDQDSVCQAARAVTSAHSQIDALFNNAGVLLDHLAYSRHGNEMHFQVNTLAPYMLMRLLRLPLQAGHGVILNVSGSVMALTGGLKVDELRQPSKFRKLFGAYAQSKFALTTLTSALSSDYQTDSIIMRSMDPGGNKTAMTGGSGMPRPMGWIRNLFFQSPSRGAEAIYRAAFGNRFGNQTGIYIANGKIKTPPRDALDPAIQSSLLKLCRELTGV